MFEEILGLPAHPLIVHGAVVLIPLLAIAAAVYAVVPRWRRYVAWAVVLLAVAAPALAWAARLSGREFDKFLTARGEISGEFTARVADHRSLGDVLSWLSLALGLAALLMVGVQMARARGWGGSGRTGTGNIVAVVLAVAVLGLAGVTSWYVYEAGHSGAKMVWERE